MDRKSEWSKYQYIPGIRQRDHVVNVHVASLCPGFAIVGRIPRSAGGSAGVVLLDVGAIANEEGLTGGTTALLFCLYMVLICTGE